MVVLLELLLLCYVLASSFLPVLETFLFQIMTTACARTELVEMGTSARPAEGSSQEWDRHRTNTCVTFRLGYTRGSFFLAVSGVVWEVDILLLWIYFKNDIMLNLPSVEVNERLQYSSLTVYHYCGVVFYRLCCLFSRF